MFTNLNFNSTPQTSSLRETSDLSSMNQMNFNNSQVTVTPSLNDFENTSVAPDFGTPLLQDNIKISFSGDFELNKNISLVNNANNNQNINNIMPLKGSEGLMNQDDHFEVPNLDTIQRITNTPLIDNPNNNFGLDILSPHINFNHVPFSLFSPHLAQPLNTPIIDNAHVSPFLNMGMNSVGVNQPIFTPLIDSGNLFTPTNNPFTPLLDNINNNNNNNNNNNIFYSPYGGMVDQSPLISNLTQGLEEPLFKLTDDDFTKPSPLLTNQLALDAIFNASVQAANETPLIDPINELINSLQGTPMLDFNTGMLPDEIPLISNVNDGINNNQYESLLLNDNNFSAPIESGPSLFPETKITPLIDSSIQENETLISKEIKIAPLIPASTQDNETSVPSTPPRRLKRGEKQITKERKRFPCTFEGCPLVFARLFNLKTHLITHDPNRIKTYGCSICPRRFDRKHDLRRHELSVHRDKSVECKKCGGRFKNKTEFQKHLNISATCFQE